MKTIAKILMFLGLILLMIASGPQDANSIQKNGDNPILNNPLGVKTMEYENDFIGDDRIVAVTIKTAPWMRSFLYLPNKVVWGKGVQFPSSHKQILTVRIARIAIIIIPLTLIIIGIIIFVIVIYKEGNIPPPYVDWYSDGERDPMFP